MKVGDIVSFVGCSARYCHDCLRCKHAKWDVKRYNGEIISMPYPDRYAIRTSDDEPCLFTEAELSPMGVAQDAIDRMLNS